MVWALAACSAHGQPGCPLARGDKLKEAGPGRGGASCPRMNKKAKSRVTVKAPLRSRDRLCGWGKRILKNSSSRRKPIGCSEILSAADDCSLVLCLQPACSSAMETMQELIPFAKEMLSQKSNRKMVKMYMLGSMLAFVGVVIGLVETVCSPFTSEGKLEDEEVEEEKKKASASPAQEVVVLPKQEVVLEKSKQTVAPRNLVNRQRAS